MLGLDSNLCCIFGFSLIGFFLVAVFGNNASFFVFFSNAAFHKPVQPSYSFSNEVI